MSYHIQHEYIIFEKKILRCFLLTLVALTILFPYFVILGYILPLVTTLPIASTLRLILEHADVDINIPLPIGTNYKTGPISRILFFYGSGDCHLIHHLFPKMPFYHIKKASLALQPILKRYSVAEHRSLIKLIYGFYFLKLPHRSQWKQLV